MSSKKKKGQQKKTSTKNGINNKNRVTQGSSTPLRYASDALRNDKEIVLSAVTTNGLALGDASEERKRDPEMVCAAVEQNDLAWNCVPKDAKKNKQFILGCVSRNGNMLAFASANQRDNEEIVMTAVNQFGMALRFASDRMKSREDIVKAAVTKDGTALTLASKELRFNKDILLAATANYGLAVQYASKQLKNDKDVIQTAVKNHGRALQYASNDLKAEFDVVLAAVQQDGIALKFADQSMRMNKTIVSEACKQNQNAIQFATDELRRTREVALIASGFPDCKDDAYELDTVSNMKIINWTYNLQLQSRYRYKMKKYMHKDFNFIANMSDIFRSDPRYPGWVKMLQQEGDQTTFFRDLAIAFFELPEERQTLDTMRATAACIRHNTVAGVGGLMFGGDVIPDDRFPDLVPLILFKTVEKKLREGASRPFFPVDKLKRLEDELGIGMCSNYYHRCNNCFKSHRNTELSKCSCCKRVWYCSGNDCNARDWARHKKEECGEKWRKKRLQFPNKIRFMITKSLIEKDLENNGPGISMQVDKFPEEPLLFCLDTAKDEIFDALTDRVVCYKE